MSRSPHRLIAAAGNAFSARSGAEMVHVACDEFAGCGDSEMAINNSSWFSLASDWGPRMRGNYAFFTMEAWTGSLIPSTRRRSMGGNVLATLCARLGHMISSFSRLFNTSTGIAFATFILAGCEHTNDCFHLRREMPIIELVDRVGDSGIPFYDTVLSFANAYDDYPRCSDFDPLVPGARISMSNVGVVAEGFVCALMTADAQIGTVNVPFDLPLEDSMLGRATLFYSGELSLDGGHLLLGASSAQFGECSGYWLVVVSSGLDPDSDDLYTDPGEGSLPPWTVYRMFRPSDDPGCVDMEPCVDGFTARMVMPP